MATKIVHAKVFPASKKEKFIEVGENAFDVYVREPAQRNLANFRVRECIAAHYGVEVAQVSIQTGHRARKKTLAVIMKK